MSRTEAVALIEAKVFTWREDDLTDRFKKIASSQAYPVSRFGQQSILVAGSYCLRPIGRLHAKPRYDA